MKINENTKENAERLNEILGILKKHDVKDG